MVNTAENSRPFLFKESQDYFTFFDLLPTAKETKIG